MTPSVDDVVFRARALAQAHPLTAVAKRFIEAAVEQERDSQPLTEFSVWAGAALVNGYCVRRVEESDAGFRPVPDESDASPDLAHLGRATGRVAQDLRVGDPSVHLFGDEQRTLDVLDRIVVAEVERRLDHWRESVDEQGWNELADYLAWWVVRGYALRIAETASPVRT